jgi:L-iditol 2-dehydrogenase
MCQRGHFSLCENLFEASLDPGGFSELIRIPERIVKQGLLHIPDEIDFATASLTEPLACCVHGLEALEIQAGQSLVVIGDGPMGLLQAALGKSLGAEPIILSGITAERLDFSRQIVDVVVDAVKMELREVVARTIPGGAEKVIVSVGDAAIAQSALSLVCKGGTINLFAGMPHGAEITLDVNRVHYDEIKILGTFGFGPNHFRRSLDLLASGKLPISGMITSTVTLDEIKEALKAAGRYEGIKTLVLVDERREKQLWA